MKRIPDRSTLRQLHGESFDLVRADIESELAAAHGCIGQRLFDTVQFGCGTTTVLRSLEQVPDCLEIGS